MDSQPAAPPVLPPKMRAPKLAQRLVADFSEKIQKGIFPAGSKLPPEHEIMRAQLVSRAVVREAIALLQSAGLVESRHGIGTFVLATPKRTNFRIDPATVTSMADVLSLLELRISFECEAAFLAAQRHQPAHLERMRRFIEEIQAKLERGEPTTSSDYEFHLAIADATRNRYFVDILEHLGLAILPRTRVDVRYYVAGDHVSRYLAQSNSEHREIFAAITRSDGEAARAGMRLHLTRSRDLLKQRFESAETSGA